MGYLPLTVLVASLLGFQALAGQPQEVGYETRGVQALSRRPKEGLYKTKEATCRLMDRSGVNAECSFVEKRSSVRMQGKYKEDGDLDLLAVTYTDLTSGREIKSYVIQEACNAMPGTPNCKPRNSKEAKQSEIRFIEIAGKTINLKYLDSSGPSPPGDLKTKVK